MSEFKHKKSLGQNFIKDDNIIDKIVRYSGITKDDLIIEIGPGEGSLSKKIVPLSYYSLLYEIDTRLKDTLESVLSAYDNYEIIFGDFLEQNTNNIRKKYHDKKISVVANLPYYITTPIITKLVNELYPDKIIVMVQKEVADRLAAREGSKEYGMISVLLGSRYDIKKLFDVSRKCFIPMPNVDSSVICFSKNDQLGSVDKSIFEKLIKDAFQFKRKNLRNNLKKYDLDKVSAVLGKHGLDLSCRAEDLSVEEFIEIANNL